MSDTPSAPNGDATPTARTPLKERAKNPIRGLLLAVLLPLTLPALTASALVVRVFVAEAFEVGGPSMEPALLDRDRMVVDKAAYGVFLPFTDEAMLSWAAPEPGEIAIIHSPMDDIDIVKRIIGVAGDTIEIRDDVVFRNGEPVERGPEEACGPPAAPDCVMRTERIGERVWWTSSSSLNRPDSIALTEVPEGHVYVLGDHRDRSNDSRNPRVGMIPLRRLKGRVEFRYWRDGPVWEGVQ